MLNARGAIVLSVAALAATLLIGYRAGVYHERLAWSGWTYAHVAFETKGDRYAP